MNQDYSPADAPAPKPRKARCAWTDGDQQKAELLREAGLTYEAIARSLGVSRSSVYRHLVPEAAETQREQHRAWIKRNREEVREYSHTYYRENLIERKAYSTNYYRENAESRRAYARDHYAQDPEAGRNIAAEWRKRNPDAVRDMTRKIRRQNPSLYRELNRRRIAAKRAGRQVALDPLTPAQKRAIFEHFDNCCAYCGNADTLTVDHVLPLSKGGLDEASNIVPACGSCNSKKNARLVEHWYRRQSFFSEKRWKKVRDHCPRTTTGQLSLAVPL